MWRNPPQVSGDPGGPDGDNVAEAVEEPQTGPTVGVRTERPPTTRLTIRPPVDTRDTATNIRTGIPVRRHVEVYRVDSGRRRPERTATARRERMPWRWIDLAVGLFFLVGAYIVTSSMWTSPSGKTPTANSTDQTFFEWMLVHALRIFTHGENPFFTKQLNAPLGVNLMANTGLLGLGIPLAPITAWLGPAVTFDLIIMLGLAGTAFSWYYVLSRHFVGSRPGAVVGAIVCGFGPGIITHANAHPNLVAQFMVPLILWRALALRDSKRPVRDGLILGLMITYQVFINEEVLFLTALAGTMFVLVYIAFRPSAVRDAARPVLIGLTVAGSLSLVLLAYPLWFQFYGPQHFSGLPLFLQDSYRLPLGSYVRLPQLSRWGDPNANQYYSTQTEENSFFGWILLVVAVGSVIMLWRRHPAVRSLAIISVLFAWGSLGKVVTIGGVGGKQYHLALWSHLNTKPIFDSVLPSRLALPVLVSIGVVLAFAFAAAVDIINEMDQRFPGRLAVAVAGGAAVVTGVITILPIPIPVSQRADIPVFFTSGDWRRYVPAGDSVLSATAYDTIRNMAWDVRSGLDFSVPNGYFLGPDGVPKDPAHPDQQRGQYGPQWRQTAEVLGSVGSGTWEMTDNVDHWRALARCDLRFWHTAIIVLDPRSVTSDVAGDLKSTVDQLVGPGTQVDDVWLWDVRWMKDLPATVGPLPDGSCPPDTTSG